MDRRYVHGHIGARAGRNRFSRRDPRLYAAGILFRLVRDLATSNELPPATTFLLALNFLLFFLPKLLPFLPPWMQPYARAVSRVAKPQSACVRPSAVLSGGRAARSRLLWAALVHVNELHLAYNMSSLWAKGRAVEKRLGSASLLALTAYLGVGAHVLYVGFAVFARDALGTSRWLDACVVGFSGVLFGLGVVLMQDRRFASGGGPVRTRVLGLLVPRMWAPWVELVLTSAVAPHVSFLGHLCGIVAGMAYVHVPRIVARLIHSGARRR